MATCHAPVASLGRGVAIRHWAAVAAGLGLGAAEMDEKTPESLRRGKIKDIA
jgi:hypothetical protein